MKATIDLENLESIVSEVLNKDVERIVREEVALLVKKTVESSAKNKIEEIVNMNFQKYVDEYIKTTVIKVGGNFWNDEEEKSYTVDQFIKEQLKDIFEKQHFKIKTKSSYGDNQKCVTFEEYINETFDVNGEVKKRFDKIMDDIRKQINKDMKDTFDSATKSMLSSAVLNVLSANETFKKIENNIKCIADRNDE